jgi:hypothetical protein
MNNLTNKLFTAMVDLAQKLGTVTKVADQLLNRLIPQEDVLAEKCWTILCTGCFGKTKVCTLSCCGLGIPPCRQVFKTRPC